ncbi:MAG: heme exporter protein CcmB, partial [Dehalococcoidia bacterium]|nr:heme exporter protein CcmB [Dehalococcoidia bacterium]
VRDDLVPGVLWVAFSFAGVLAMTRAFVLEKERGSSQGLLLAPVSRDAIYFGKMLASLIFMLVVEAAFLPIFAVLFNFTHFSPYLIVVLLLATLGFVAVGTLFSAIAVNTRSREIMLPVLFLPIVAPVIIAAVESTSALVGTGVQGVSTGRWMGLIRVFDMVFLVGCPWVFGLVVEE